MTISVRGLRKSFGPVEVLHGIDLDLPPGKVVALLGENGAGKSTFVRVLAGDHQPDAGQIVLDGAPVAVRDVAAARGLGIRLISQEIADAPTLSVAENVSLGDWPHRAGIVSRRALHQRAREVLDLLRSDIDPGRTVGSLRLGERQIVEIARALVGESRCVVFDEPTAALSDAEARRLFAVIEGLRARGVTVLYITHRLDEVFRIADQVCVLRDGVVSLDAPVAEVTTARVVEAMVGRSVATERFRAGAAPGGVRLSVTAATTDAFTDVSFPVRAGEVLGLYGKIGSGVPEVAEALIGERRLRAGGIEVDGRPVRLRSAAEAITAGIGYLPPDRKGQALLGPRSVAENLVAPTWRRLSRGGLITRGPESRAYRRWHDVLAVRSRNDPEQGIATLSGGNQQKVLLGRWLEAGSKVLVLVEPTRGVDVGARHEIYRAVRDLADGGSAVVVASSDYEDVVAVCDTALVMVRGRVVARVAGDGVTTQTLTRAAGGAVHA
ncbi:sugar ABC transporter ATP-binding protein [Kineococcus glutinatus]|uniref:Sugar ABC transporter ATP-binding protein n=1 Tax=Kineococcus glutinatus TaxID=1070872 RepID=A0ABP9HHG8_9ACTN